MRKLKIIYSILISVIIVSCSSAKVASVKVIENPLFTTEELNKHRITINIRQAELTGIMATKYMEGEWRGSIINEFGVKAFDFVINNNKCRIKNPISFLNKWYIRKTVESDLEFLFANSTQNSKKGKLLTVNTNGFTLTNQKRNIKYHFRELEE